MVLGNWSRKDRLYGGEGYSVTGNGDLAEQFKEAIGRLPRFELPQSPTGPRNPRHRRSRHRRKNATSTKAVSSSAMIRSSTNYKTARA